MTAKDIQKALANYYVNGVRYLVPNVYFFGHHYCETDLLVVKESNGWIYDIEIKVSRADFKADFKKTDKHRILQQGNISRTTTRSVQHGPGLFGREEMETIHEAKRPNRFYFAVPEGLIKPDELPPYAGLLYVNDIGVVNKVKEAPVLHKERLEPEKTLCRKFYYAFHELRSYRDENGVNALKSKISILEKQNIGFEENAVEYQNRWLTMKMAYQNLIDNMKTIRKVEIEPVFVRFIPPRNEMEENKIYISKEYKSASHLCLCGCKEYVHTPLNSSGWELSEGNKGVSLTPSIGSFNLKCKSHYIITNNVANFV